MVRYIAGVIASFLPPRYRPEVTPRAAVVSGIAEALVAIFVLIFRAMAFLGPRTNVDINNPLVAGAEMPGSGIFLLAEFWLNPLNLVLFYFVVEGMGRTLAALVSQQVIGTAPLYIFSALHNRADRKAYKQGLGPLVVDEVIHGGAKSDYSLKVYSCRPKLNWNPYMTVEFDGEFYQYFKEEQGPLPRRFIYYLRKNPVGRVVVVIDHYQIDSVLKSEPDKWAGKPGFWDKAFPDWNLPPLVPDELVRGGSTRQEFDLKIYSCRPKADWNSEVTIAFDDQWYQLIKDEKSSKPRPYIYYLRKISATRPGMAIRRYDPGEVLKSKK